MVKICQEHLITRVKYDIYIDLQGSNMIFTLKK